MLVCFSRIPSGTLFITWTFVWLLMGLLVEPLSGFDNYLEQNISISFVEQKSNKWLMAVIVQKVTLRI